MNRRCRRGGALGIVIITAITIVLLGVCFFFMAQIFGGSREQTNATDAASLNVAKHALTLPNTTLNGDVEVRNFQTLGDGNTNRINLRTYNRCFGHALLVAINARNDGNQQGIDNANTLIARLQGVGQSPKSIGDRLSEELSKTSDNVLFPHFAIARSNSVRMLGKGTDFQQIENNFRTSFLEQDRQDPQATNLRVENSILSLFDGLNITTTVDGRTYLRGYEPSVVGEITPVVGVPVQPRRQPHLVSRRDFDRQRTRFDDITHSMVPPNGFQTVSTTEEARTKQQALSTSWSVVGSLDAEFTTSIPLGYIEVVNGPASTPVGPFSGSNTWLENEGGNEMGGTMVSGQCFGNPTIMGEWRAYNEAMAQNPPPNPQPSQPSLNGVFSRTNGSPATLAQAQTISGAPVHCLDVDVAAGGNPTCINLWQGGNGPFDRAYYGNPPGTAPVNPSASPVNNQLIAIECAKCQLQQMFNAEQAFTVNCQDSGLRIFACSANMPSPAPKGNCVISQTSNIEGLGNHATRASSGTPGSFGTTMVNFIVERCKQIKPDLDEGQLRSLLSSTQVPIGSRMYVYMNQANGQMTFDNGPPHNNFQSSEPDGTPDNRSHSYTLQKGGECGMINPHGDFGIHDIMYYEEANPNFTGTDRAILHPSSGFNNLLGRISFTNSASGSCALFSKPD